MTLQLPVKKFFIALFMVVFSSVNLQAQLQEIESAKTNWTTVGEIKWLANTKASLKYFVLNSDTTYMLYLQDEQKLKNSNDMTVRKYFSISFSGKDNTADTLYELLTSFFTSGNKKNKKLTKIFTLGKEMVHVQHYPKIGGAAIMFSTKGNNIIFKEKELKKLFGK